MIAELEKVTGEVKALSGLVPICSICKKIRDDEGGWNPLEAFIQQRSTAKFSHSLCPDCLQKNYSDLDTDDDTR